MTERKIVTLAVGDWSDDGHGKYQDFIAEYTGELQSVRDAHFNSYAATGVDLQNFCRQYGDNRLPDSIRQLAIDKGWEIQEYNTSELLEDFNIYLMAHDIAILWVKILDLTDPSLQIKLCPQRKIDTLHFYGYDEKRRHLNVPGYGVFE